MKKIKIILPLLVIAGIVTGIIVYARSNNTSTRLEPTNPEYTSADNVTRTNHETTNSEPDTDQKDQDSQTDSYIAEQAKQEKVDPVISTWGQNDTGDLEVNGFAPDIIETDGKCTLTLKKGSAVIAETKNATPDAQTTTCGLMVVKADRLSAGKWTATLSYSSAKHSGASSAQQIEIQL